MSKASLVLTDELIDAALSPDGRTAVAATGAGVKLGDVSKDFEEAAPLEHEGRVLSVAFSPDGGTVATGGADDRFDPVQDRLQRGQRHGVVATGVAPHSPGHGGKLSGDLAHQQRAPRHEVVAQAEARLVAVEQARPDLVDPAAQGGTVGVDVTLEGPLPAGARSDLSVDGTITIEKLVNIVYVGRPSFGQDNGSIGLFKVTADGREAVKVTVKLGRTSVSTVEILDGLQPGDVVILSDMSQYDTFDRVRLK